MLSLKKTQVHKQNKHPSSTRDFFLINEFEEPSTFKACIAYLTVDKPTFFYEIGLWDYSNTRLHYSQRVIPIAPEGLRLSQTRHTNNDMYI